MRFELRGSNNEYLFLLSRRAQNIYVWFGMCRVYGKSATIGRQILAVLRKNKLKTARCLKLVLSAGTLDTYGHIKILWQQ